MLAFTFSPFLLAVIAHISAPLISIFPSSISEPT
nr:MAG TPA: hypothetical protein [Caudoviricetes sp.]